MRLKKKIWQYTTNGELVATWESLYKIKIETELNITNICNCCNGRQKTAYGYVWSFAELTPEGVAENLTKRIGQAKKQESNQTKNTKMTPYLRYVKYLYHEYRDYCIEEEFVKGISDISTVDLPLLLKRWFSVGRKFTLYNMRNLLYKCNSHGVPKLLRYLECVEMAVASATFKMADWRGVVDSVMRTIAEERNFLWYNNQAKKTNNIPIVALAENTLEPLAVFSSLNEAVGVVGNENVAGSVKFGSTTAGCKWQRYSDYKAGKPVVEEKRPRNKTFDNNPFEYGIKSLI